MMAYKEYIACKSIDIANYDGEGNDVCCIHLTDTEIIRCRDCDYIIETLAFPEPYEEKEPIWFCGKFGHGCHANGFCAWAVRE